MKLYETLITRAAISPDKIKTRGVVETLAERKLWSRLDNTVKNIIEDCTGLQYLRTFSFSYFDL